MHPLMHQPRRKSEMYGQGVSNILPSGAHPAGVTLGVLKYVVQPQKVHMSKASS